MVQHWLRGNQIKMRYIDPGSPWQNGYSERFDSRFRDGCVNREWLLKIEDSITTQKGRIADGAI
jgi:putative transposase